MASPQARGRVNNTVAKNLHPQHCKQEGLNLTCEGLGDFLQENNNFVLMCYNSVSPEVISKHPHKQKSTTAIGVCNLLGQMGFVS